MIYSSQSPLLTDLYQLTMMQVYHDKGMQDEAVFEFFFRKLPKERTFLVSCGLQQVLEYLENLNFSDEDIAFLREDGRYTTSFLESLTNFRFTGSIHAMPEGTIFFPDEPVIRVTAPLSQAQLVETRIINILQFQSIIASKAVRMKRLMPDKMLVDYGLRRSHGAEAGIMAARASYIAGFHGTATVLAGKMFGIPLYGTMAHSFIQAHESEDSAFMDFALSHPNNTVILLDTYDTEKAVIKVINLANELKKQDIHIRAVRLDSGNMIDLSKRVRQMLDAAGLQEILIFASGNLDEYSLVDFRNANAPVDGYGIGSKMTTCADVPYFDCAYKLVEYSGVGRRKLSKNKETWPGRKQIFRDCSSGVMRGDTLALEDEKHQGNSLIQQYMANGVRTRQLPSLADTRDYLRQQLETLPEYLENTDKTYPVEPSATLKAYAEEVSARMKLKNQ
jgi:nicotinate phosphoribosyltransferase